MSMTITPELFQRLPKVELHCHLDGSLRVATIIDIAQKERIPLPTTNPEHLKKQLSVGT